MDDRGSEKSREHQHDEPPRRPYKRPALIEFGPVAKLTQNMNTGSIADGMGMMMTCL